MMSLAPKIDEVAYPVQNANFDLFCVTETYWLQKHIPNNTADIEGFNLIRVDRKLSIEEFVAL